MNAIGFIKLHRSMLSWEWYDSIETARLFIHLLLTVNWEPQEWRGIVVERGQRVCSIAKLSSETGLSARTIRTCIERLVSTNEVTKQIYPQFTVISIKNYDEYQTATSETTSERQGSDKATTRQQCENRQASDTVQTSENTTNTDDGEQPNDKPATRQRCENRQQYKKVRSKEGKKEDYIPPISPLEDEPLQEPVKPVAHKRGQHGYVKLTDDEYTRLVADIGESEVLRVIEYVDESAATTRNKNRWQNWNLVLRKAAREGWGTKGQQRDRLQQPERKKTSGFTPSKGFKRA